MLWRALSWLKQKLDERVQKFVIRVLSAGPVPKHVAFVMDGNRRYARANHMKVQQGHSDGFVALRRLLGICLQLNVRCVSVYAFAIDNFKRPSEEVDALMALAEAKLRELCQHGDLLQQYGVRLNVIGRVDMLPESVREAVRVAEDLTRHNDRAILNLCMPYASRDEMTRAVQDAAQEKIDLGTRNTMVEEKDIEKHLMTSVAGSPPLDVLVRTSGVQRLSDYMLWQSCEGVQLHFSTTYWPEFGLSDFLPIILDYQRKQWCL
ncbi:Decaprenyl diphosphate synthase-like protein [Schizophyllum amplum]|uniref:Alkyl transferase n=1 Tax=Schizophyllum amplum TaxID=97359 RepID=A0A550C1I7_9AGAR|nr:Decaprenyl diphosphate synthase-like protein [Auriculariopsis ampla]